MRPRAPFAACCSALVLTLALALPSHAASPPPPPNHKVAFLGDQGSSVDSTAVLRLILAEGADAVLHSGDFDYDDDPAAWEARINSVLGPRFPYFASAGNHDESAYYGSGGYQSFLQARMNRLGIPWSGDLGVQSSHAYQGVYYVMTAPDVFGAGDGYHDLYIRDQLAADDHVWRISSWHKNMNRMQAGGKSDEAGWGVYEASRRGGAIVATGHEHSYSRSHEMHDIDTQQFVVANPIRLRADDPGTAPDDGTTFVFVAGLGGRSIRDQGIQPTPAWWGSVYTSDQGANFGALFGVFNVQGDPRRAHFYFKNVDGVVVDEFDVYSSLGQDGSCAGGCPPGADPPTRQQQQCIDAVNKSFVGLAKLQGARLASCIANGARGRLAQTIAACEDAPAQGGLARAIASAGVVDARKCSATPPPFGATDAMTRIDSASATVGDWARLLLGPDLDAAVVPGALDVTASRCQQAVVGAALRCFGARLSDASRCESQMARASALRDPESLAKCAFADSLPGQRTCGRPLDRAIDKLCVARGVDLQAAFPGCATTDPIALAECVRDAAQSQTCFGIGDAHGLPAALPDYEARCEDAVP